MSRCLTSIRTLAILVSALGVSGCITYSPNLPYEGCPFVPEDEASATIRADAKWQPTGVWVKEGDELFMEAEGKWRSWALDPSIGPDGICQFLLPIWWPFVFWTLEAPFESYCSLVGKVGDSGAFKVGSQKRLVSSTSGPLLMTMNVINNGATCSGHMEVTVTRRHVSAGQRTASKKARSPKASSLRVEAPSSIRNTHVLVIGIASYKDANIPKLNYTMPDARSIYEFFKEHGSSRANPKNVHFLGDQPNEDGLVDAWGEVYLTR